MYAHNYIYISSSVLLKVIQFSPNPEPSPEVFMYIQKNGFLLLRAKAEFQKKL
jgi:hypothetical protein